MVLVGRDNKYIPCDEGDFHIAKSVNAGAAGDQNEFIVTVHIFFDFSGRRIRFNFTAMDDVSELESHNKYP